MTSTFTSGKASLEKPGAGDYPGSWNTPVNADWDYVDACFSATTSITLSNTSVTLTQAQMRCARVLLTGALSASVNLNLLTAVPGSFVIDNRTTGAFTVTVLTSTGGSTGVVAPQGYRSTVYSDGTNVVLSDDGTTLPQPGSISNTMLATAGTLTLKGNLTGGTASVTDNAVSAVAGALGQYFATAGFVSGLVVKNGGTPNVQITLTATAAAIPLTTGMGAIWRTGISITANTGASGVNGIDTGTVAASTWYHVWLIDNGSAPALLLSTSPTAPTLPGGYTYAVRVGEVRTDGSSLLYRTTQKGEDIQYTVASATNTAAYPVMSNAVTGNITVSGALTSISVSNFVPPTATRIRAQLNNQSASSAVAPNNNFGGVQTSTAPPVSIIAIQLSVLADFELETAAVYYGSQSASNVLSCVGWKTSAPVC